MKAKRRKMTRRKKTVLILGMVGLGLAGGIVGRGTPVYYLLTANAEEGKEEQAAGEVLSAQAQKGTISSTISGSGSLAYEDARNISVLSEVKYSSVLIESGSVVKKGDVLATIDTEALEETILEVQENISSIDTQMNTILTSGTTSSVKTNVAGRVKLIYASAGESVSDVMLEQGALAVLSADGKMAVSITDGGSLSVGNSVTVTLSSGTAVTGTVAEIADGSCVITVTDDGTTYGDTVTVTDSDGTVFGSGSLYIHQPISIVGSEGTISTVNVSENQKVSSGTSLFTLKTSSQTAEYKKLTNQRAELVQKLNLLLQLSESPQITAAYDGVIKEVNISAEESLSSAETVESETTQSAESATEATAEQDTATEIADSSTTEQSQSSVTADTTASETAAVQTITLSETDNAGNGNGIRLVLLSSEQEATAEQEAVADQSTEQVVQSQKSETSSQESGETVQNTTETDAQVLAVSADQAETQSNSQTEADSKSGDITQGSTVQPTAQQADVQETDAQTTESQTSKTISKIELPVPAAPATGETLATSTVETNYYKAKAVWEQTDATAQADSVYSAKITLKAKDGYIFDQKVETSLSASAPSSLTMENISEIKVDSDGKTLTYKVTYPKTASDTDNGSTENTEQTTETESETSSADNGTIETETDSASGTDNGSDTETEPVTETDQTSETDPAAETESDLATEPTTESEAELLEIQNGSGTENGITAGSSGSWGGAWDSGSSSGSESSGTTGSTADTSSGSDSGTETDTTTSASTTVAFSIYPTEYMSLQINIDELDVLSTAVGQKATVTLDAISGQTFEGTIVSVSDSASSGNGSAAKYTAVIRLPKDDSMRAGMTASAVITTSEASDVLVIPADAVTEKGNTSYVYTSVDATTGELSGETEVTTGLSDGTQVEITGGLTEGTTVYYQKTESADASSSSSSDSSDEFGGMMDMGGGMGDFGGGPGGGME